MAAVTDCNLGTIRERRDGDWVTVGGIISQPKRLRTKKGDMMMFANLEDLEGSVELVVFAKALEEGADALLADAIVLVRGRVDHKDQLRTCVVVQKIEPFEPSSETVHEAQAQAAEAELLAKAPLHLRLDASALPSTALNDLKDVLADFPGEAEVVIELRTRGGERRLCLGPAFRVSRGPELHAELAARLGSAILPGVPQGERVTVAVA
jgi:DNA polymerase-3 subunit alpha